MNTSRRHFLAGTGALVCLGRQAAGWSRNSIVAPPGATSGGYKGKLCFFSKPLAEMEWGQLAKNLKSLGFDGVDLTVRHEQGHVMPERAREDLPTAVAAFRGEGVDVPMITTSLTSADDPTARPILSTAGKLGISYFKPGYYLYKFVDVEKELEEAGKQFRGLAELAQQCGIQAGYHNHEDYIGAPVWDMARVIEPLEPQWAGYYFDPRHAVAEGGVGAWKIATHLVARRLKMVAVKDFYWEKTARKGWTDVNCPLGQGMVDWKYFFATIAGAGFQGPISVHLEYDIPGASREAKEENTLAAAKQDLKFLIARVREAYASV